MKNDYMTIDSFTKTEFFKNLKPNIQELSFFLFEKLEKEDLSFMIHTGKSSHRFVLWANKTLERKRDRDFLTIFTRSDGLLLWPKFYGVGWKTDEKYQKVVYNKSQIDEDYLKTIKKAYISICKRDLI